MSHTSCLLMWTLSQYLLRVRYRHASSSSHITTYKKERAPVHTELHHHTKDHSWRSKFSQTREKGNSIETSDIRSSFCSNFRSMTRLAMSLVYCRDDLLASCLWSELRSFQSSLDFLFNSQLKSIKNSAYASIQWTYRQVRGLIILPHDRGIKLYTSRGATLSLINFTYRPPSASTYYDENPIKWVIHGVCGVFSRPLNFSLSRLYVIVPHETGFVKRKMH